MAAKHSAGPWHDRGLDIVNAEGKTIAQMVWDQGGRGTGAHEISPNLRLLAAAPELAAALKGLLAAHMWGKTEHRCGWCNAARDALANAGVTP